MLHESDTRDMVTCYLMKDVSSILSYRLELEGSYRLLTHTQMCGMEDVEIAQWGDNLRAVNSTKREPSSPKDMIRPKVCLVLAIHNKKRKMPNVKESKHVYAHQDTRNITNKGKN